MEKKVETFKFGPFTFSSKHVEKKLKPLLIESHILYVTIQDIPILPVLASQIEEDLVKRSIFGTAAIEGNPLSEDEVKRVLSDEEVKNKTLKAELQIKNLKVAYEIIRKTPRSDTPFALNEELIKSLNKIITTGCEEQGNSPGEYRNTPVKVGDLAHGGVYTPPKVLDDIKDLMKYFIEWINSPEIIAEDKFVRACLAHYYLAIIHPFENGNGRTARAVEAILLKSCGIKYVPHMLSNFYYKNIDDYFFAFSKSEHSAENDITPFIEFFLIGLVSSLTEIKGVISVWIQSLALENYYTYLRKNKTITQRQFNLMTLLLNQHQEFSLNDLFDKDFFKVIYRNISERTARRDLDKLKQVGLIIPNEKGNYILNNKVLG